MLSSCARITNRFNLFSSPASAREMRWWINHISRIKSQSVSPVMEQFTDSALTLLVDIAVAFLRASVPLTILIYLPSADLFAELAANELTKCQIQSQRNRSVLELKLMNWKTERATFSWLHWLMLMVQIYKINDNWKLQYKFMIFAQIVSLILQYIFINCPDINAALYSTTRWWDYADEIYFKSSCLSRYLHK